MLKQIKLSDVAGMVARGEAVGGAEAEALEAAHHQPVGVAAGGAPVAADRTDTAAKEPEPR